MKIFVMLGSVILMSVSSASAQNADLNLECKGTYTTRTAFGTTVNDGYTIFHISGENYTTDSGGGQAVLIMDGTVEMGSDTIFLTDPDGVVHSINRNSGKFFFSPGYWGGSIALVSADINCSAVEVKF